MSRDEIAARVDQRMQEEDWQGVLDVLGAGDDDSVHEHFDLSWNRGWALVKLERYQEAAAALERARELAAAGTTEEAVACWALGIAYTEVEQLDDAERVLERSLELRDAYVAWIALGLLHARAGRMEDAEAVYREAVDRRPHSRRRVEALADFLSDVGKDVEARTWYERARVLSGNDAP